MIRFWIEKAILAILVILLGWALFENKDFLLSFIDTSEESTSAPVEIVDQALKNKTENSYRKDREDTNTNAAATGLTKFYTKIYGNGESGGPKIRNNIIYLPKPKGNLEKLLQARMIMVRPYNKNWRGSVESRSFRKGQTMYHKLAEYTKKEGVELIWWLNRDYIVKDPFRIDNNTLNTALQIANAVEGHFSSGLSTYFCYNQRAIVIIETMPRPFLDDDCTLLGTRNLY